MFASPRTSFVLLTAGAILALAGVDLALSRLAPPPEPLLEAEDGIAAYERGDPDTLLLGSSHTRSFAAMRDLLDLPSGGARQTVLVPLEWGTMAPYEWVLRHRLHPLMDERAPDGSLKRRRLSRAIFITEFYDLCHHKSEIANLPARAWAFSHFAADLVQNGLTDYNRNYLQTRLLRLFPHSVLVQDRGKPQVIEALKDRLRPPAAEVRARRREVQIARLRRQMEEMYPLCDDPVERRAFESTLLSLSARGLEVTVVVFPMARVVISPRIDATQRFSAYVAAVGRRLGVRVVDLTRRAPLNDRSEPPDGDLMPDLEHLSSHGGRKLTAWALEHDLAFLRTPLLPGGRR